MKILTHTIFYVLLVFLSAISFAAVLPDERIDGMVHSYDGGGLEVNGPAILIRKNATSNSSVFYNGYQDNITSASIDVQISGSPYTEARTEQTLGVDYLHGKTSMSLSYTDSTENDYEANTISFSISQDFFGDLSTVTMGYSQGEDEVSERTNNAPLTFVKRASIDRRNFRVGFNQILTKNASIGFGWETITDEGTSAAGSTTTLNNPYRQYSYRTGTDQRLFDDELYPRTRTSNAFAIRGNYYIQPFKSALHYEYRWFNDSWGITSNTYGLSYAHPFKDYMLEFRLRYYEQDKADFYRDLFDFANQFDFMARDKELSTFTSTSIGFGISYEFAKTGWGWIDKGSLNVSYDFISFEYKDFRDATQTSTTVPAGTEPLYSFEADVIQAFISIWY